MKSKGIFYLIVSFTMLLILTTFTYAYFIYYKEGPPVVIEVKTIVLSVNGNVDSNRINSQDIMLEKPGDYHDFQIKVENLGISAYIYDINFGLDETNELLRAIEIHYLDQNDEYVFISMLKDINSHLDLFSDILSGSEYDLYELRLVYSAGASDYYQGLSFSMIMTVTATMIFEEDLEKDYGIYYASSLESLTNTINKINNLESKPFTPVIKLLSDIKLESNLLITKKMSLDLNGKKIDLAGYRINFSYTDTPISPRAMLYNSLAYYAGSSSSLDCLVDSGGGGLVVANVLGGFMIIDKLFNDSNLISLNSYDYNAIKSYIRDLIDIESQKNLTTILNLHENIEFYIKKGYIIYSPSVDMDSYIEKNDYIINIIQTDYTSQKEINMTVLFSSDDMSSSTLIVANEYVVVLGRGSAALANEAIANFPNEIDSSIFLKVYDPDYNAYYTWITENADLFSGDGIYLRNGYEIFDHYGFVTIRIGVLVEQNGIQYFADKEVKVNILNAKNCTELINEDIYDVVLLDNEGDSFDGLGKNTTNTELLTKTQLKSITFLIDQANNHEPFDETIKLIEVIDGKIVLTHKPTGLASTTIKVTVTFVYEHGTYVVEVDVIVIGYAQTIEQINVYNTLMQYIPKDDVYQDFEIITSINEKYEIEYRDDAVPLIYRNYFSIQKINDKYMIVFKKPNLPNKITEVYLTCYVNDERFDLNFKITGLIHNDIDDVPDENLYLFLLSTFDLYPKDGWLTVHELNVTRTAALNINSKSISNIKGIEFLTGCTNINLSTNSIVDLTPLSTMYQLETLNLSTNQIADVTPLANLDNLKTLNLGTNIIYSFDSIKYLSKIETLYLSSNLIQDFSPLENMTSLKTLHIVRSSSDTFILLPNNKYYYALLYDKCQKSGTDLKIYIVNASTLYVPSQEEIIAARVLSSISNVTTIYDVLNLMTEYSYQGTNYGIYWESNDELILKIINRDYTIFPQIGENDIYLYATVAGFDGSSTINRLFKVSIKSADMPEYEIELASGEILPLEYVIPDRILRNILFNTFNIYANGDEKYLLSQADLNPGNLIYLDLNSKGIKDFAGLEHFVNCISGLDIRNNNLVDSNATMSKINALTNLTKLFVNNAKYDFSLLIDLDKLIEFTVYGSFQLTDENVLTGLYKVYANNPGISIYKDSNTLVWNPWLIPLQRALLNLPSFLTLGTIGDKYIFAENNLLRIDGYDTYITILVKCDYMTLYNNFDVSHFVMIENGQASVELIKCFPYTASLYITLTNAGVNSYGLAFTNYTEVHVEYNEEVMYKDSTGQFISLIEAFPNRLLRYQVIDNAVFQTDSTTGYIYVDSNSLSYITEVKIEGGTDILDNDGNSYAPIKGLELLPNLTDVTLWRFLTLSSEDVSNYMAYSGSKIKSLTIMYTVMSTECLNPLSNQLESLVIDVCKNVNVDDGLGDFSKLKTLKIINSGVYFMNFLNKFNEKFNDLEEEEIAPVALETLYIYGNPGIVYESVINSFENLHTNIRKNFSERILDFRRINSTTVQDDIPFEEDEILKAARIAAWPTLKNNIVAIEPLIKKDGITGYISYNDLTYMNSNDKITQSHMLKNGDKVYLPKYVYPLKAAHDTNYINDESLKFLVQYFYETMSATSVSRSSQQSIKDGATYKSLFDLQPTFGSTVVKIDGEDYYEININITPLIDILTTIVAVVGYDLDLLTNSTDTLKFKLIFIHGGSLPYALDTTSGLEIQTVVTTQTDYVKKEIKNGNTLAYSTVTSYIVPTNQTDLISLVNLAAENYFSPANFREKLFMSEVTKIFPHNDNQSTLIRGTYSATLVRTLTTISLNQRGITDIHGIEMFSALTSITLYDNFIVDISPLSKLTSLNTLSIYRNAIADLSPLKDLENLTTVNLTANNITSLIDKSVGGLSSVFKKSLANGKLTSLTLTYNNIDLDSLLALKNDIETTSSTSLTTLNLSANKVSGSITAVYIIRDMAMIIKNNGRTANISWGISATGIGTAPTTLIDELNYIISTFETMYRIEFRNNQYQYEYEYYEIVNDIKTLLTTTGTADLFHGYPIYPLSTLTPLTEHVVNVRGASGNEANYFILIGSDGVKELAVNYYDVSLFGTNNTYVVSGYFSKVSGIIKTQATINFYNGFDVEMYITLNFKQTNATSTTDEYFIEYQDGATIKQVSLSDRTAFPDAGFSNYLLGLLLAQQPNPNQQIFDLATVGKITSISAGTKIGVTAFRSSGWTSIEGIKYFPNITSITAQSQLLTDIPVPTLNGDNNIKITTLNLTGCYQLESLINIKYYQGLTTLNLTNTGFFDLAEDKDETNTSSMEYIAKLPKVTNFQYNNTNYYPKLTERYMPLKLSLTQGLFNLSGADIKSINNYTTNVSYRNYLSGANYYYNNTYYENFLERIDSLVYRLMIYESTALGTMSTRTQTTAAINYVLGIETVGSALVYKNKFKSGEGTVNYLTTKVFFHNYVYELEYAFGTVPSGATLEKDGNNDRYKLIVTNTDLSSFVITPKITKVYCDNILVYNNSTGRSLGNVTCHTQNEGGTAYIFDEAYVEIESGIKYVKAQEVFEDPYFLALIMNNTSINPVSSNTTLINNVQVNDRKILSQTEITNTTSLTASGEVPVNGTDVSRCLVSSIKGIELFINLTSLTLNDNLITDLSPISGLTKLVTFQFRHTYIRNYYHNGGVDLSPLLSSRATLNTIDLTPNILDITILMDFPALTTVRFYDINLSWTSVASNVSNDLRSTQNYVYLYYWFKLYRPTVNISALYAPIVNVNGAVVAAEILSKITLPENNADVATFNDTGSSIIINKDRIENGLYTVNLNEYIDHSGKEYQVTYNMVDTSAFIDINNYVMTVKPFTVQTPYAKITARISFENSDGVEVSLERNILIIIQ